MELKVGEKIRMRRHQMGMTLKELAGNQVTAAQISAVEKGKCRASETLLQYIAEKLDTDVEYFILTDNERLRKKFEKIKLNADKFVSENNYEKAADVLEEFKEDIESLLDSQRGYYFKILGDLEYSRKCFINAFEFYVKSATFYLKVRDLWNTVYVYNRIGNCLYNSEKFNAAIGYYLTACQYYEASGDDSLNARVLYNTALCYFNLKRYKSAEEYIKKCRKFIELKDWPDKEELATWLEMINGAIKIELDENVDAFNIFKNGFEKYSSKNDILSMGRTKNNEAICLWHLGRIDEAISYFKDAINYKITVNDATLVDTYINLSDLYKELKDMNTALEIIGKAEDKALELNFQKGAIKAFMKKFQYLYEVGEYDKAEIVAFIALDYIEKNGDKRDKINLYIELSEMYKRLGDEALSVEYVVKAKALMV